MLQLVLSAVEPRLAEAWRTTCGDLESVTVDDHGELIVGDAVVVGTGNVAIPYLIAAPTMRVPMRLGGRDSHRLSADDPAIRSPSMSAPDGSDSQPLPVSMTDDGTGTLVSTGWPRVRSALGSLRKPSCPPNS